jgi:hypothetical protein
VLVGAALRPYVERHKPAPGRVASVRRDVERAWTDHRVWVDRKGRAMQKELAKADENLVGRGMYESGVRATFTPRFVVSTSMSSKTISVRPCERRPIP